MRFQIKGRDEGKTIKELILEYGNSITVMTVKQFCELSFDPEDISYGWFTKDLKGKMCVRHNKDGWFLYLPDPVEVPVSFFQSENEESEDIEWIRYLMDQFSIILDRRRPVELIHRKDRKIEKRYGMFHGWTTNRVVKEDGTIVDQLLAIVEFPDGHVERVDHKNILFSWYEEV